MSQHARSTDSPTRAKVFKTIREWWAVGWTMLGALIAIVTAFVTVQIGLAQKGADIDDLKLVVKDEVGAVNTRIEKVEKAHKDDHDILINTQAMGKETHDWVNELIREKRKQ